MSTLVGYCSCSLNDWTDNFEWCVICFLLTLALDVRRLPIDQTAKITIDCKSSLHLSTWSSPYYITRYHTAMMFEGFQGCWEVPVPRSTVSLIVLGFLKKIRYSTLQKVYCAISIMVYYYCIIKVWQHGPLYYGPRPLYFRCNSGAPM